VGFRLLSALLALLSVAVLSSCGGGGGDAGPAPGRIRFVNATVDERLEFEVRGVTVSLGPREVSDVLLVDREADRLNVSRPGQFLFFSGILVRPDEVNTFVVQRGTDGVLFPSRIQTPGANASAQALVWFQGGVASHPLLDWYLLSPGQSLQDQIPVSPVTLSSAVSREFPAGDYKVVVTRRAARSILFESSPFTLAPGDVVSLMPVQRSVNVVTPQVLFLKGAEARYLDDPRPQVRLFHEIPNRARTERLTIDGDLIVDARGTFVDSRDRYHVSIGPHQLDRIVYSTGLSQTWTAEAGALYVQPLWWSGAGTVHFIAWAAPARIEGTPPADVARLRIIVSYGCFGSETRINGSLVLAGAGEASLDLAPGLVSIRSTYPPTGEAQGAAEFVAQGGHVYFVFATDRGRICVGDSRMIPRDIVVSSDD
jgi:hypothetical protein